MQIFKYPLSMTSDVQHIELPADSKIVHVGFQQREPFVWALHTADHSAVQEWGFLILPTGENPWNTSPKDHLGTVQVDEYVWHFFGWVQPDWSES